MRSAVSLALIACLTTAVPTGAQEQREDWSRLLKLAPGTGIIVTVKGSEPLHRYFVAGDDSSLTVLNVDAPALPRAARAVLRDVASTHSQYFSAAQQGGQFLLQKNVRLGPEGVFVADLKVADLSEVVEQYPRDAVAEIETAKIDSNPVGCALAGYYGGGIVGGLPGAFVGGAVGRDTGPALAGMMVGWSIGALYVYRKCRHKPEKVVYQAP
jgi:hypothetical protein